MNDSKEKDLTAVMMSINQIATRVEYEISPQLDKVTTILENGIPRRVQTMEKKIEEIEDGMSVFYKFKIQVIAIIAASISILGIIEKFTNILD